MFLSKCKTDIMCFITYNVLYFNDLPIYLPIHLSFHHLLFYEKKVFVDTDGSQDSRRREGTVLITLYHFHSLTNIKTFIWGYTSDIASYFSLQPM